MNGCDPSSEDQSNPSHPQLAGLQFLTDMILSECAGRKTPSYRVRAELSARAAAWRPVLKRPVDLVGRECSLPAPQWHWQRLLEHVGNGVGPESDVDRARRLYHARWLAHLLAPERTAFQPRVTILIPVFNRAAMAVEAIESCLAQDYRALEILVIDDGSTDDLAGALRRFGNAVRLHRQPNGGVSSARNAGIRLARGDFIHFLDSDNLLLPRAVARKVEGFAHFPDAELCYSMATIKGARGAPLPAPVIPGSRLDCPTVSLLECDHMVPFYVSCVMLPRFTAISSGGFEEDLRRSEDTRFWSRLALHETKVIGIAAELTVRRLSDSTLSGTPIDPRLHSIIHARTTADFLGHPRAWRRAVHSFRGVLHHSLTDERSRFKIPEHDLSTLLAAISALGNGKKHGDLSPLPLLAQLRHLMWGALARRGAIPTDKATLLEQLHSAIDVAAHKSAKLGALDVTHWSNGAIRVRGWRRLLSFLRLCNRLAESEPAILPELDDLLRRSPSIPSGRTIRAYLRLRRWKLPRWLTLKLVLRSLR